MVCLSPVRYNQLKKSILIAFAVLSALPAFAGDGTYELASLDRNVYRQKARTVLAPELREKREYYTITGGEEKDLREQLTRKGTAWSDGKKYDSLTTWHLEWGYEHDWSAQSCNAEAFQASAEVTIRYPEWIPTDDAPQELVDKWKEYLANLVLHEEGHRDMVLEAVGDITNAVAKLSDAPTCADIDRMVKALCHERMAKLNVDTRAYDAMTSHGAEQGAVFP